MARGTLFYVIGPSGAGKDSIIDGTLATLPPTAPVIRAHRYITRPATAGGENHVAVTAEDFARRRDAGLFLFSWESHGHAYGLGVELRFWLEAGFTVIMNGSRGYLPEATQRWSDLIPVLIHVSRDALRARLESRGRESPAEIERRLARANAFAVEHPKLVTLDNSGPLETAIAQLRALLPAPKCHVHLSER